MKCVGNSCMTKVGMDLVQEGIFDDGVTFRGVRHRNSALLTEGVEENSVHFRVPIDGPVDFFDKVRILLVTTFEHVVPVGICREEVRNCVCGEALGLCKPHLIIITVLANPLLMQIVLIGC